MTPYDPQAFPSYVWIHSRMWLKRPGAAWRPGRKPYFPLRQEAINRLSQPPFLPRLQSLWNGRFLWARAFLSGIVPQRGVLQEVLELLFPMTHGLASWGVKLHNTDDEQPERWGNNSTPYRRWFGQSWLPPLNWVTFMTNLLVWPAPKSSYSGHYLLLDWGCKTVLSKCRLNGQTWSSLTLLHLERPQFGLSRVTPTLWMRIQPCQASLASASLTSQDDAALARTIDRTLYGRLASCSFRESCHQRPLKPPPSEEILHIRQEKCRAARLQIWFRVFIVNQFPFCWDAKYTGLRFLKKDTHKNMWKEITLSR